MKLTEKKREQIIQAATIEFREQGFQGCSMDKISLRAQVSKRTVYNHFSSKEVLFFSILEQLSDQENELFPKRYNPSIPVETQLLEIARNEVELLQSSEIQQFSRILLGELVRSEEMAKMFDKQRPSCQANFTQWLNAARDDGALDIDDISIAVEQFFGLIKTGAFWPTLLRKHELTDYEKEKIISSTVSMFLKAYGQIENQESNPG